MADEEGYAHDRGAFNMQLRAIGNFSRFQKIPQRSSSSEKNKTGNVFAAPTSHHVADEKARARNEEKKIRAAKKLKSGVSKA